MKKYIQIFIALFIIMLPKFVFGQYGEPEIQGIEAPKNLFDEGYTTGFGISLNLNDFGFGAGVQLRKRVKSIY